MARGKMLAACNARTLTSTLFNFHRVLRMLGKGIIISQRHCGVPTFGAAYMVSGSGMVSTSVGAAEDGRGGNAVNVKATAMVIRGTSERDSGVFEASRWWWWSR